MSRRELCDAFLTETVFLCMALTGSRCTHREPRCFSSHRRLAGCHRTVNSFRRRLEMESTLLVSSPVLQFIPSSVTTKRVRDTDVPREIPAAEGARCKRELRSASCCGTRLQRARAAKRHCTIKRSGHRRNLGERNIFHCPRVGSGAPLCFPMKSSASPSDN